VVESFLTCREGGGDKDVGVVVVSLAAGFGDSASDVNA
jgi:hypothetical protein